MSVVSAATVRRARGRARHTETERGGREKQREQLMVEMADLRVKLQSTNNDSP